MLKTSAKITVSVRNYWAFFQLNVKFSQVQVIFCFKKNGCANEQSGQCMYVRNKCIDNDSTSKPTEFVSIHV